MIREPSNGVQDGSTAELRIGIPGTQGRVGPHWVAEHDNYRKDQGFDDFMVSGPLKDWRHHREFRALAIGSEPRTEIREEITYEFPSPLPNAVGEWFSDAQLEKFFAYRTRQLADDLAFHAAHHGQGPRKILISGASGLVGTQLVALLGGGGHTVRTLTRGTPTMPTQLQWDPTHGELNLDLLREADVVIHLAGEPIGKRFTAKHREAVMDSRVDSTLVLARSLAAIADDHRERALIVASASGFYGPDRGDEVLTEESRPGSGFLADVCRAWEGACEPARAAGVRVVNVRTGMVQTPAGGQLALQLPLFLAGLGGRLGDGRQWMPWITIDDLVGLYAHVALTPGLSGPVNACAPEPVTNAEYARTLGHVVHRPALLPVPKFGPAALLGGQGAKELALAGQRMSASRAEAWGYQFRHRTLAAGLHHVLAR